MRKLILGLVFLLASAVSARANWGIVQQSVSPQFQASTVTGQFPTSVTAGDLILVHVIWATTNMNVTSITDTLGNTYASAALAQGTTSSLQISSQLFYAANVKGGLDQVTVTISGSTFFNIMIYEIAGAATTNPLDVTATGNGTGLAVSTNTTTTTSANDFIFVGDAHHYGSDSVGAGFVGLQSTPTGIGEYQTASFAGTSVTGTASIAGMNSSFPWAVVLAAFKTNPGTVSGGTPTLTSIQVSPVSPTISFGQKQALNAVGTYSDGSTQNLTGSVAWASTNSSVASIDATGLATAVGHGTTTISATSGSVSGSTTLTVEGILGSIQVTPSTLSVNLGANQQFTATGIFNDGFSENLSGLTSWSSSNTTVATVNASGLVNAIGAGTATITATSGAITGSASLTVNQPVGVVPTPVTGAPLAQSNFQWFSSYFMQVPPTAGLSACAPAPCIAQTFLNPNTAGNMIFVWVGWNAGGFNLTGLSDSAGNTYVHVPGFPMSLNGNLTDDFWVAYNINASANNKITALFGSGAFEPTYLQMLEYSGTTTTNALDVYSTIHRQNQCVSPCTMTTAPTPTTTQASELLVAIFDVMRGTISTGSGWAPDASCLGCLGWETDVSGFVLVEHQLVNSTGSYSATISNAYTGWPAYNAYLFTFKLHP